MEGKEEKNDQRTGQEKSAPLLKLENKTQYRKENESIQWKMI